MSKNRVIGGFEEVLERGQSTITTAAKQTVTDFAGTAKGQLTGGQNPPSQNSPQTSSSDHGSNEHGASGQNQHMSDDAAQQYLKDLYGVKDQNKSSSRGGHDDSQKGSGSLSQVLGIPEKDSNAGKTPDEIAKMQALRIQLHQKYIRDTFDRPKQKEESVTEKLEREDKEEEMQELATQRENPPPLNPTVKQGTAESESALSSG